MPADMTTNSSQTAGMEQPRFLTLIDVAEILNVTARQVYSLVRTGELRGIQIGGRGVWRVEDHELEKYIQRQYERIDLFETDLQEFSN